MTTQEKITNENFREIKKVNIAGIELPEALDKSTAPKKEAFLDYIDDDFALEMKKKVATAWLMDEPVLLEGGTSLGKTRTILKMCSELGYEQHKLVLSRETDRIEILGSPTVNPNYGDKKEDGETDDRKFIIVLSHLVKAITPEEGKVKVCILDEINSAMPGVLIKLHEILDAYKFNSTTLEFPELGGIKVKVDKNKVKFVGLMNPPGAGYQDRNQIDPANLRRWVYHKLPDTLPKETLENSVDQIFGIVKKEDAKKEIPIINSKEAIPLSEFENIKGLKEIIPQYLAFHTSIKEMVEKRQLGNNQPQRFTFDDREEPRRVQNYISKFYSGDISETMQEALRYFYLGKIMDEQDKKKVEEMVRKVAYIETHDKNRHGLGSKEENKKETQETGMSSGDIESLKSSGLLDESFEGKPIHNLELKDLTKDEALKAYKESGGSTWIWDKLEEKMPYTTPSPKNLEVAIISFGENISSEDAIEKMDKQGFRAMTYEEIIQFAIANPEYQKKNTLVALGSKHVLGGSVRVPVVRWNGDDRDLGAGAWAIGWIDEYRFLFVRK